MVDLIADFEAEHIFGHSLWGDDDVRVFLEIRGHNPYFALARSA